MNSILANIFLQVQTRLAAANVYKWIDQDLGQLEFSERPQLLYPSVLIDLSEINYSDAATYSQIAEGVLCIRLAVAAYNPSAQVITGSRKNEAMNYYDLEENLNKLLHNWAIDGLTSPFTRISASTERREDNLRVRVLRYKYSFTDNSAFPETHTIERPELVLTTNY